MAEGRRRNNDDDEGYQGTDKKWYERLWDMMTPDFSIGGIFGMAIWGAIFAGIAFMVFKYIPGAKDWIPDEWKIGIEGLVNRMGLSLFPDVLLNMEPSSTDPENKNNARYLLTHHGTPAEIANVLTADRATWQGFIRLVKDANGGKANADTLMNDKTITRLLLESTPLAAQLINALPARGAAPAAAPATPGSPAPRPPSTDKIMDALKKIIANPTALNQILARDDTRLLVSQALVKLTPPNSIGFNPGSEQALSDFIKVVGMNNGATVTPEFTTFLNAAMTGQTAQITPYITNAMATNPTQTYAFLAAIDLTTVTDAGLKTTIENALSPQTQQALATLNTAAGADATRGVMQAIVSGDPSQTPTIINYIMTPAVLAQPQALAALANNVNLESLPADSPMRDMIIMLKYNAAPVTTLLRSLGDEKARQFIDLLQTKGPEAEIAITRFVMRTDNAAFFKTFADSCRLDKLPPGDIANNITALHQTRPDQVQEGVAIIQSGFNKPGVENIFNIRGTDGRSGFSLPYAIGNLMDGGKRSYLREQIALLPRAEATSMLRRINPALNLENINVMLNFMDKLEANPDNWNSDAARLRTRTVLTAVASIFTTADPDKKMDAFKALTPETVSTFFGTQGNARAFYTVLYSLKGLPPREARIIKTMEDHWLMTDGTGISQVLGDRRGAEFIIKHLRGENKAEWVDVGATGILFRNLLHLIALNDASKALTADAPERAATTADVAPPPRTPTVSRPGVAPGPRLTRAPAGA